MKITFHENGIWMEQMERDQRWRRKETKSSRQYFPLGDRLCEMLGGQKINSAIEFQGKKLTWGYKSAGTSSGFNGGALKIADPDLYMQIIQQQNGKEYAVYCVKKPISGWDCFFEGENKTPKQVSRMSKQEKSEYGVETIAVTENNMKELVDRIRRMAGETV